MIYGYIRVSTDRQTVENQRFVINNFCDTSSITVGTWIEETISGSKNVNERKLGKLIKKMRKKDVLICSELSRLGRNMFMIMSILYECMQRDIQVWTVKERYRLGVDVNSKVMAFAFGISAELERNLISLRTKEALQRIKAAGVRLGPGYKLEGKEADVQQMLVNKMTIKDIATQFGISNNTVTRFIRARNLTVYLTHSEIMVARNKLHGKENKIKAMLAENHSPEDIAAYYGVNRYIVRSVIEKIKKAAV
jgi:DNA invertase Pin-like site-specific DNA recombinase